MKITDHLVALLVVFIWGTNFVFIRMGLDDLAPFTFATLRFLLVALPLVLIVSKPNVSWTNLIGYGICIGVGQFGLLFWAMQSNISPGLASLIIQIQVFFTILLSALLLNERVRGYQWTALAISLLGLMIVIVFTDGHTTAIGVVVVLVAAMSWAGGNLLAKQAGEINYLAYIAWSSLFAILPLAIMSLAFDGMEQISEGLSNSRWQTWAIIIWQSVGNTIIGYGLWNWLLSRHSAASVTPWALMVPVFGMTASAWFLEESMPWWKLLAIGLILTGLVLNAAYSRKR